MVKRPLRRPARLLVTALAAVGLLALLTGAAQRPGPHRHTTGVEYHSKTVTLAPGETTVTFDCPTGYSLIWLAGWEGRPGIFLEELEPTSSGQGALITLWNDSSIALELEVIGTCIKPATGTARDRKGRPHTHGLDRPELVGQIVRLDPFSGGEPSVSCPAGSFPTLGVAERDAAVELQGSYGKPADGAWQFELFNPGRTTPVEVRLKLLCLAPRTRAPRDHGHLLLFVTPRIVRDVESAPRHPRATAVAVGATFEVACPAGYRAISGGWSIPQGLFEIVSEAIGESGYTLELEASSQLPTVEVAATCLARRTAKAG